jgi:Putative prokaryotic signal transducing protein
MEQDQVIVGEFRNEIDAEIAKGHLESEGIPAFIIKGDIGGAFPSLQNTGGVQLAVDEADEDRARAILNEKHP